MKASLAIIAVAASAIFSGCAAQPPVQTSQASVTARQFSPEPATALAFDPPMSSQVSPQLLARDPREPSAFAGFEQTQVEYYDQSTSDDQYIDDATQEYERQNTSERIGVTYR